MNNESRNHANNRFRPGAHENMKVVDESVVDIAADRLICGRASTKSIFWG